MTFLIEQFNFKTQRFSYTFRKDLEFSMQKKKPDLVISNIIENPSKDEIYAVARSVKKSNKLLS